MVILGGRYVYLVSTLYEGGELFDRILERRMYNEADAACIMAQVRAA